MEPQAASPPEVPNPFLGDRDDRENFPPLSQGVFMRGVPPVPESGDSPSTLPHERSAQRQARAHCSSSYASPGDGQVDDVASGDFIDGVQALNDLSNNLDSPIADDESILFMKADAGRPQFQIGDTPVNVRRGAVETPNTRQARKAREAQELKAAQREDERYFNDRQQQPGSTPKALGRPLYIAGQTPQQPPRSGDSQSSAPHSGRRGGMGSSTTPSVWGPSPSIPEDRQADDVFHKDTQTDISIGPTLLCQLVPITPSGEVERVGSSGSIGIDAPDATPEGLGARLNEYHRRPPTTTTPVTRQHQSEHQPFDASISPMAVADTPQPQPIGCSRHTIARSAVSSPSRADPMMTGFPGVHSQRVQSPDEWSLHDAAARGNGKGLDPGMSPIHAASNTDVISQSGFFADSAISAPHVSGAGSVPPSGNDVTRGYTQSSDRSLPPPHPDVAHDDGSPLSPIAQSQSPDHTVNHSPGEFGGSPRHFGDGVDFEPSPIRSPQDGIDAVSSIHSASSPSPAARRSLQQALLEAESPVRSDRQSNSDSLGGLRDGITNTLSFSQSSALRGNGSSNVVHGGGSALLGSQTSMQHVAAFSDESSGGHEFDEEHLSNRSRIAATSARSLGRDGEGKQRSVSSGTQTDNPEDHESGTAGWVVDSDHHDEVTQSNVEHAFLQGTTQESKAPELLQHDKPPEAQQQLQQVSPPAIGAPTGASPLCATTAAATFGQAMGHRAVGHATHAVAADYQPPHQRYERYPVQHGGPRAAGASPAPTGTSPSPTAGSTTPPTAQTYSPPTGHVAYGMGTVHAFSTAAAMSSARVRPQTVLGLGTVSPSSATPFVSPFRVPPSLSSWRSPLGYSMPSALLRPTASSLSFHRHYSGSPILRSGLHYSYR